MDQTRAGGNRREKTAGAAVSRPPRRLFLRQTLLSSARAKNSRNDRFFRSLAFALPGPFGGFPAPEPPVAPVSRAKKRSRPKPFRARGRFLT